MVNTKPKLEDLFDVEGEKCLKCGTTINTTMVGESAFKKPPFLCYPCLNDWGEYLKEHKWKTNEDWGKLLIKWSKVRTIRPLVKFIFR